MTSVSLLTDKLRIATITDTISTSIITADVEAYDAGLSFRTATASQDV